MARKKDTPLSLKMAKLLDEIHAEHESVELSPWNLTLEEVKNWSKEESDWDRGKRDYTAQDVWDASNYKEFNEANMGSVYRHWLDSKKTSFAIITSYQATSADTIAKSEKIKHDNKESFSRLKSNLSGYGYFDVLGHSEETVNSVKSVIQEPSLFVIGIPLDKAMSLARDYHQWGIIYCGPETQGKVKVYYTSGKIEDIGDFHPGKVAAAYSLVRGKPFVFESMLCRPEGWIANLGADHRGMKEIPGIRKARKYVSKSIGF